MKLTPIPEKEAAQMLGVTIRTVRNAIDRGALVRIPGTSLIQHVSKEQIELFMGKKRIVDGSLSFEELQRSKEISAFVSQYQYSQNTIASTVSAQSSPPFALLDRSAVMYMREHNLSLQADTAQGSVSFRSALAGEKQDSNEEEEVSDPFNGLFLLVILLGLLWLFSQASSEKLIAATRQVERTIALIGIEKEDLVTSQRETIATLRSHPTEAKKLKYILDREGYKDPLDIAS